MSHPPDVVVVGAGIVGCAIAYELARRGASVEVLEERRTGMGATYASAGMLAPFIEARAPGPFQKLSIRSLALFDGFIQRVETDSGVTIPYRRTGTLQVAVDDAGMRELRETAAALEAQGLSATLLDREAVRAEEPHLRADMVGGLVIASHGFVAAGELARALAAAVRGCGGQVIEGSRVHRIAASGEDLIVETDRGSLTGSTVVLAAGSWCSHIEIDGLPARLPVRPVRGQLLRLGWKGLPLRRVTWSDRCYLVPWEDGTLLVGATVEEAGFDEQTTVDGVRGLMDAACALMPSAATANFVDARAGLRPASLDLLPIIGRSQLYRNLVYATAHYRSGVLLAPVTAALVAETILDDRSDPALAALSPRRFGAF